MSGWACLLVIAVMEWTHLFRVRARLQDLSGCYFLADGCCRLKRFISLMLSARSLFSPRLLSSCDGSIYHDVPACAHSSPLYTTQNYFASLWGAFSGEMWTLRGGAYGLMSADDVWGTKKAYFLLQRH